MSHEADNKYTLLRRVIVNITGYNGARALAGEACQGVFYPKLKKYFYSENRHRKYSQNSQKNNAKKVWFFGKNALYLL
jgi:hypothetical protein